MGRDLRSGPFDLRDGLYLGNVSGNDWCSTLVMLENYLRQGVVTVRNVSCRLCPLWESATTVCIDGDGPEDAPLWVLGEAPGAKEDEQGKPFVGASGILLRDMLADAGYDLSRIRITNAVRCRPPENRTPTPEEIKICTQNYLIPEMEKHKPQYVVAVGATPLKVFGKSGITYYRGNPMYLPFRRDVARPNKIRPDKTVIDKAAIVGYTTVYPTFHPAYALYSPQIRPIIEQDLDVLRRIIETKDAGDGIEYHICVKPEEVLEAYHALKDEPELAFDIEAYGEPDAFNPRNENFKILCISFSPRPGVSWVLGAEHPALDRFLDYPDTDGGADDARRYEVRRLALVRAVVTRLLTSGKKLIAQNGKYDMLMLGHHWKIGQDVDGKVFAPWFDHDTMIMAYLIDENAPKGLKDLARQYCGAGNYAEEIAWVSSDGTPQIPNWGLLSVYNARDTHYTRQLFEIFRGWLNQAPGLRRLYMRLMMPAARALTEIERNGFWVDLERVDIRQKKNRETIAEWERAIYNAAGRVFNPGSTKQLVDVLYKEIGFPVVYQTKTGAPSTGGDAIVALRDIQDHPILEAIEKWRRAKGHDSRYFQRFIQDVNIDGYVYASYKLAGGTRKTSRGVEDTNAPVTGRLSGNWQQIDRDPFVRSCVGAPPGWKHLEVDLSQIELRCIAHVAQEPVLIEYYREGKDVHRLTGAGIIAFRTGERPDLDAVSKDERTLAKIVNFGFAYGMAAEHFRQFVRKEYDIKLTIEEAQAFRGIYFETYPGLLPWHRKTIQTVRDYHKVVSPIGRVRRLPNILSNDPSVRADAERQAINSPIQSFASDIMLMGMIRTREAIHEDTRRYGEVSAKLVMTLHDAIMLHVREDRAEEWAHRVIEIMRNPPLKEWFGVQMLVPIDAEAKLGQHWGEGVEIKLPLKVNV